MNQHDISSLSHTISTTLAISISSTAANRGRVSLSRGPPSGPSTGLAEPNVAPPGGCPASTQSGRLGTNRKAALWLRKHREIEIVYVHTGIVSSEKQSQQGKSKFYSANTHMAIQQASTSVTSEHCLYHTSYKQPLVCRANRVPTVNINVFVYVEQQGFIYVASQPQCISEPN